jgi:hypothetical protein
MRHDKHTYGTEWTTARQGGSHFGLDYRIKYLYVPSKSPNLMASVAPDASLLFSIFVSQEERDAFLGDLEERFRLQVTKKGSRAATRWFWQEVIHSFFSLALNALKRLSALEKLIERYRRLVPEDRYATPPIQSRTAVGVLHDEGGRWEPCRGS